MFLKLHLKSVNQVNVLIYLGEQLLYEFHIETVISLSGFCVLVCELRWTSEGVDCLSRLADRKFEFEFQEKQEMSPVKVKKKSQDR